MEIKNKFDFKINRRKLFVSTGAGAAAFFLNKVFPFHIIRTKLISRKINVIVKINPDAVSRNNMSKNNV
jgi:hypothetical protein